MVKVEIDSNSGFCFGVVNAINKAELNLKNGNGIACLGDIVHNKEEITRLEKIGMRTISHDELKNYSGKSVLIRAHGEPPATYELMRKNNVEIVDATCPIVITLQKRIRKIYLENRESQIVIFGKPNHAEVIGLVGQTNGEALVLSSINDINKIDKSKPLFLFSQTTMPLDHFHQLEVEIKKYTKQSVSIFDTICRKVSNRVPELISFANNHDVCVFVSGKKSSNGKMLFDVCKSSNPKTYFVSNCSEIDKSWFSDKMSIGICGATSTPQWLMNDVKKTIEEYFN